MCRARHTYLTNHTALQTCEVSARVWADERLCLWASLRMIVGRYTDTRTRRGPSGRKRGGQPRHLGQTRVVVPVEAVHTGVPVTPQQYPRCQHPLYGVEPQPQPGWKRCR